MWMRFERGLICAAAFSSVRFLNSSSVTGMATPNPEAGLYRTWISKLDGFCGSAAAEIPKLDDQAEGPVAFTVRKGLLAASSKSTVPVSDNIVGEAGNGPGAMAGGV